MTEHLKPKISAAFGGIFTYIFNMLYPSDTNIIGSALPYFNNFFAFVLPFLNEAIGFSLDIAHGLFGAAGGWFFYYMASIFQKRKKRKSQINDNG